MPAKICEARQKAYLKALAETGNATLAAERARVSREWAYVRRRQDAGFDAACRAALRQAQDRLWSPPLPAQPPIRSRAESPSPAAGGGAKWRYHGGMELVVQAGNGRRVQVRRARARQWTPRVEQRFLQALSATCNVRMAAAEAGMSAPSAYRHRKLWPAFAEAWERAIRIGYPRLKAALIESGIRFLAGEPVPDDAIVRTMSVAEAIQALNMNKFAVNGIGKPVGHWRGS